MKLISCLFLSQCFLISICFTELSVERKVKFLNGFVDYLNNLPNRLFSYSDGVLLNAQQIDESRYKIEVCLKVSTLHNVDTSSQQKCTVTLEDLGDNRIGIQDHDYQCEIYEPQLNSGTFNIDDVVSQEQGNTTPESGLDYQPVQLDNEVQSNTEVTSGEQFVAIPKETPVAPCIGCSTFVNPHAAGVDELAGLGIRHLNRHEPNVKHALNTVVEVERQIQVVNGVRYILKIKVDYNNCTNEVTDECSFMKPCKITILEKPWIRFNNGLKYRAILANNCTEEWVFGDDGEFISDGNKEINDRIINPSNYDQGGKEDGRQNPDYDKIANTGSVDDILKAIHNSDLQAEQLTQRTLTAEELKKLEEEIIPYNRFFETSTLSYDKITQSSELDHVNLQIISKAKANEQYTRNPNFINVEKDKEKVLNGEKKAIDDLIRFFDSISSEFKQETARSQRSPNLKFVGGQILKDKNDPLYRSLAEESLLKYLQSSNVDQDLIVDEIENVTVQVVSGKLTRILFRIAVKNKDSTSVPQRCFSQVWEKPWLNVKEINVTCQETEESSLRIKRQLPGGQQEQNPNDPKYMQLATESMHKYLQTSGNSNPHKVTEIERVTSQVVSGSLTTLYFKIKPERGSGDVISCISKVWEQPWANKKDIDVSCQIGDGSWRTKRQIRGGPQEQNPNDPKYMQLATESMQKFLQTSGNSNPHKVTEIERVTSQVVSGSLTTLYFKIKPEQGSGDVISCISKVWEQPWVNKKDIDVSCQIGDDSKRTKRQLPGGQQEQNPNDPKYMQLATESMQKFLQTSGNSNPHKVTEIERVTSQVVSGSLTTLYFKIKPEQGSGDVISCVSKVWEQPWAKKKDIDVLCQIGDGFRRVKKRVKKNVGVREEQDPSLPEFKLLAEKSLRQYEKLEGIKRRHAVILVKRVVMKVVSGMLYEIDYIASPPKCIKDASKPLSCILYCHTKIWDRPWLGRMKIDVECYKGDDEDYEDEQPLLGELLSVKENGKNHVVTVRPKHKIESKKSHIINKRSLNSKLSQSDQTAIEKLAQESLEKLEMLSSHKQKQRLFQINNYSSKITSGRVTTIDFNVGYTSCLKHELVENITNCDFLDLPKRHCVSHVWERLWLKNGKDIEVTCEDHPVQDIALDSENAITLATEALKHIEAKYPNPRRQKIVKIISLKKQVVAGVHYRMEVEVGATNCLALSIKQNCTLSSDMGANTLCRVNVWMRPWTDHPPNFRVTCNYENFHDALQRHLQAQHLFYDFLATYRPAYLNDRENMLQRFEIFKKNVKKIHELNTHEKGTATYGVTKFADLTYEEFSSKYLGLKPSLRNDNNIPMRKAAIPDVSLPDRIDWRERGAVTEVKNQGSCGSCWAFSVTGNIEGQWKIKTGNLVSLSEQELVDCDGLDQGCNGGLPDNAYRAIEQLGGLETERDYPYEGEDDKCSFNKSLSKVTISGAVNITTNETDMAKWLVSNGPISIGINANAMQFYVGGVSHPWKILCNPNKIDHGVLIVGYGEKDYPLFHKRLPYWTIKNSWGTSWGEQGYYRVYRGDGTCGVNMMASSAVI